MTPYPPPPDLEEAGLDQWRSVCDRLGERLVKSDLHALAMVCRWIDRFNRLINSDEKGVDIKLGIACDKFLLLSTKFGLTPADRKAQGDDRTVKKTERRKTAVDSLTPEALNGRGSRSKG